MSIKERLKTLAKPLGKIAGEFGTEFVAEGMFGRGRGKIIHDANEAELKKTLVPESERASLLDDIAKMDSTRRAALLRHLKEAETRTIPAAYGGVVKIMENDLVAILASIRSDEDGRRTGKLEWLADLPDDEFWAYVNLLWHNPVQQEIERSTEIIIDGANQMAQALGVAFGVIEKGDELGADKLDELIAKMNAAGFRRHGR